MVVALGPIRFLFVIEYMCSWRLYSSGHPRIVSLGLNPLLLVFVHCDLGIV